MPLGEITTKTTKSYMARTVGRKELCCVKTVVTDVEFPVPILSRTLIHSFAYKLFEILLSGILDIVGTHLAADALLQT